MDRYNVALIGKTGHGKSCTGNTILRRVIFDTASTAASGSTLVEEKSSIFNTTVVKVYDTPGLCDSEMTAKADKKRARRNMDIMMESANKLDALILVYKYNTTWTKEESETIRILEEIFGKTFLENHGIVVVTCGDVLDKDIPEGESCQQFFSKWIAKQKPGFIELVGKVNRRIVLVYNKGDFKEGSKRMTSSKEILEMVISLKNVKGFYTKQEYEDQKRRCTIQ